MEQEIAQLRGQVETLERLVNSLMSTATIPWEVQEAFRDRLIKNLVSEDDLPEGFEDAPLPSITAPSGGTTVDSQARTAINTIITRLEDLGLVEPN